MTAGAFERAMADPMVVVQEIFLRGVVGAKCHQTDHFS
jgi:hypothetical protein